MMRKSMEISINNNTYQWLFFYGFLLCCITTGGSADGNTFLYQQQKIELTIHMNDTMAVWFKYGNGLVKPSLMITDKRKETNCKVPMMEHSKQEWHKIDLQMVKLDHQILGYIKSLNNWTCNITSSTDDPVEFIAFGKVMLTTTDPNLLGPAEIRLMIGLVSVVVILMISLLVHVYTCFRCCRAPTSTDQKDAVQSPTQMALL